MYRVKYEGKEGYSTTGLTYSVRYMHRIAQLSKVKPRDKIRATLARPSYLLPMSDPKEKLVLHIFPSREAIKPRMLTKSSMSA